MEGGGDYRRGCIKTTKGPWVVRRPGRNGQITTSLRQPSAQERENNRQREQRRRRVTARIFSCLRQHGNYSLPKHPDQNDILKAVCEEAGWHVEDDGTAYRKSIINNPPSSPKEGFNALLSLRLPRKECHVMQLLSTQIMTNVDCLATLSQEETTTDASHEDQLELTLGLPIWSM